MEGARPFDDRQGELAALDRFWAEHSAQCVPVVGRRRVGKTYLLEHFAAGKRQVYHRCNLQGTEHQLARLGAAIAEVSGDPVLRAQPPSTWEAVLAAIERLAAAGRLLLIVDEVPYWVAKDDGVPSILQNWWDARGRYLDLMLVLCGSAVQMMEKLLTGPAPLAGCVTGRLRVHPFDFRAAAAMTRLADPVDALTAYGIRPPGLLRPGRHPVGFGPAAPLSGAVGSTCPPRGQLQPHVVGRAGGRGAVSGAGRRPAATAARSVDGRRRPSDDRPRGCPASAASPSYVIG